ncbi:MAG: hypothetical protein R2742_02410 [Micropruina glycogenica]
MISQHANRAVFTDADQIGWAAAVRCPVYVVRHGRPASGNEPAAVADPLAGPRKRSGHQAGHLPWIEQPEQLVTVGEIRAGRQVLSQTWAQFDGSDAYRLAEVGLSPKCSAFRQKWNRPEPEVEPSPQSAYDGRLADVVWRHAVAEV